jgi:hypothetical protein
MFFRWFSRRNDPHRMSVPRRPTAPPCHPASPAGFARSRGASAGSFFNSGEGLGARLLGPNDLTQNRERGRREESADSPIYFGRQP